MKVVIIGGGACGASAAARLRRLDEAAEIIILERTSEISIANCGLPYYTSNVISDRKDMIVSSPEKFKNWFNIDVRLNSEVISVNPQKNMWSFIMAIKFLMTSLCWQPVQNRLFLIFTV